MKGAFSATGSIESVLVRRRSTPWPAGTITAPIVWLLLAITVSGVELVTTAVVNSVPVGRREERDRRLDRTAGRRCVPSAHDRPPEPSTQEP